MQSSLAYYNEIDPYAAQWLRNLIDAGHIAWGVVDERSIEDVHPSDLDGFTQCHFFAGVGVWSLALRRAGWPDDRPVWTGSCPCQPFSAAGAGAGFDDERHLWPHFHWLIAQRRPAVVLGEQVASRDADPWIDLVCADLEAVGYAVGAVPFPSAGVGAPHIRDRLYWVADAASGGREHGSVRGRSGRGQVPQHAVSLAAADGATSRLAHSSLGGWGKERPHAGWRPVGDREEGLAAGSVHGGGAGGLADTKRQHRGCEAEPSHHRQPQADGSADRVGGCGGAPGRLGHAECDGLRSGRRLAADIAYEPGNGSLHADTPATAGPVNGLWRAADWLLCRDGRWRPVEPGTFPLAAIPAGGVGPLQPGVLRMARRNRVGRLRAYGNAINASAAEVFVRCVMESNHAD